MAKIDFQPRPAQQHILSYTGGRMGISAVPGSGKTWTLSLLAAELIRKRALSDTQEILVVTLVNSAVNNFSQRISSFLEGYGLVPSLGYRVRTLHGLAHDIVRERPELAGLDSSFQIIDDREANRLREDAVYSWMANHPDRIARYLKSDLSESKKKELLQKRIPELLGQVCLQFIRSAKNAHCAAEYLRAKNSAMAEKLDLFEIGLELYEIYQRSLEYRGAVDFDDLITKAYTVLGSDRGLLARLQEQWPFILEDEAQDSSLMQQQILGLLAGEGSSNWVRVGDPNQAIYETFTTADPALFTQFVSQAEHQYLLPNSGRNTESIISLANYLVDWTNHSHPNRDVRNALVPNWIVPTPPGDIQANPADKPDQIHLHSEALDSEQELRAVSSSVVKFIENHPEKTVAVLAPRNARGKALSQIMRNDYGLEPVELLNSTLATRKTTGAIVRILTFIQDPISPRKIAGAFETCFRDLRSDPDVWEKIQDISAKIARNKPAEQFLAPAPGSDPLVFLPELDQFAADLLGQFRLTAQQWLATSILPLDQQVLTIGKDLLASPADLSLAHKISVFIKQLQNRHPDWGSEYLIDELKALARNERKFFSATKEDQFDPSSHKGKVVITTAHKAKGLEWDRVYLISANSYNFPSGDSAETYIAEKWFIDQGLNLPAETTAQLAAAIGETPDPYQQGAATIAARNEYIRERLRLFYVSITRAKEDLIITWNTGRNGKQKPALPLIALRDYYEANIRDAS